MASSGTGSFPRISSTATKKKECSNFEPQKWRQTVCRNCYKNRSDHAPPAATDAGGGSDTTDSSNVATTPSPPEDPTATSIRKPESPNARRNIQSAGSGNNDKSAKMASPRESKKLSSSPSTVRGTGRKSPSPNRKSGSSSTSGTSRVIGSRKSASTTDPRYVEELENDFFDLEDKYEALLRDRDEDEMETEERRRLMEDLEEQVNDYRTKVVLLEKRTAHMDEEIRGYRERLKLPESDQASGSSRGMDDRLSEAELQRRVDEVETLCQELMEENDMLKEEIEEMQREIEEMHDHFQEDDTDTLRELQRELESSNKNCRILQFKLRKAERRYEQCEAERVALEEKVQRLEMQVYTEGDMNHIRMMEEELRMAKEVSVRLNHELDVMDEQKTRYEMENRHLREEIQDSEGRRLGLENEMGRLRLEVDKMRNDPGLGSPLQLTDKNQSRPRLTPNRSLSREPSFEEQQLQRELDATKERETDVAEQLRFAEDETRKLKRRLNDVEDENDSLTKKLESLVVGKAGRLGSDSEPDEEDVHNMRIQVQLLEQETSILRKKVVSLERENDTLINEKRRDSRARSSEARGEKDNQLSPSYSTSSKPAPLVPVVSIEPPEDESPCRVDISNDLRSENRELRARLREFDRQLKLTVQEVSSRCSVAQENVETKLRERNQELDETLKEKELHLSRLKKRLAEAQEERGKEPKEPRQEQLKAQIKDLETSMDKMRSEFASQESEYLSVVSSVEIKNGLLAGLLTLVQQRADQVQEELDKIHLSGGVIRKSVGNDDVFESQEESQTGSESTEKLASRVRSLDRLLSEERQRTWLAEKKAEMSSNQSSIKMKLKMAASSLGGSQENQFNSQLTDALKKELQEKVDAIDDKDREIGELKSRLDQARKMNEAMRALIDKDEDTDSGSKSKVSEAQRLELINCMKELEAVKKDLKQVTTRLGEAERNRDRLIKDKKTLLEELKVREESVMEQDEELAKKNNYIQEISQLLEEEKLETESLREEINRLTDDINILSSTSQKQVSTLTDDNSRLTLTLNECRIQMEEQHMDLGQAEERAKFLGEAVRNRDERIREKDELIQHINQRLANREAEMADLDRLLSQTTEKLCQAEIEMKELSVRQGEHDRETKQLMTKLDQAKAELEVKSSETSKMKQSLDDMTVEHKSCSSTISRLREEKLRLETTSSRSANGKADDVTLETVGRLRMEIETIRKDNEQKELAWEKERRGLERRANSAERNLLALDTATAPVVDFSTPGSGSDSQAPSAKQQTKIMILAEQITKLNRSSIELKLQNESLQREILEQQRKYRYIKEQYDAEQEAWISERSFLELKSREHDERRSLLQAARHSLSEANIKVTEIEKQMRKQQIEFDKMKLELENENAKLQTKLTSTEENQQQKVPKVLQRFNKGSAIATGGKVSGVMEASFEKEKSEVKIKLERVEKSLAKVRNDLVDREEQWATEKIEMLSKAETLRQTLESEIEQLKQSTAQSEAYQKQWENSHNRLREIEDAQEREQRMWNQERISLQYRAEEARLVVEQWLMKLKDSLGEVEPEKITAANFKDNNSVADTVKSISMEMDKFTRYEKKMPMSTLRRRLNPEEWNIHGGSTESSTGSTQALQPGTSSTLPGGPRFSPSPLLGGHMLGIGGRSSSMDWSGPCYGPASQLQVNGSSGSALDRASSTADISVRKVSNYPDPNPGFLLRASRQSSQDSVASMPAEYLTPGMPSALDDYTTRSFTVPAKPSAMRSSIMSPARQRFYENYEKRLASDSAPSIPAIIPPSSSSGSMDASKPPLHPSTGSSVKMSASSASLQSGEGEISTPTKSKGRVRSFFSSKTKEKEKGSGDSSKSGSSTKLAETSQKSEHRAADHIKSFLSRFKSSESLGPTSPAKESAQTAPKPTTTTTTSTIDSGSAKKSSISSPNNMTTSTSSSSSSTAVDDKKKYAITSSTVTDLSAKSATNDESGSTKLASSLKTGSTSLPQKQVKFESESNATDMSSTSASKTTATTDKASSFSTTTSSSVSAKKDTITPAKPSSTIASDETVKSSTSTPSSTNGNGSNGNGGSTASKPAPAATKLGIVSSISERRKLFAKSDSTASSSSITSSKPFWAKK